MSKAKNKMLVLANCPQKQQIPHPPNCRNPASVSNLLETDSKSDLLSIMFPVSLKYCSFHPCHFCSKAKQCRTSQKSAHRTSNIVYLWYPTANNNTLPVINPLVTKRGQLDLGAAMQEHNWECSPMGTEQVLGLQLLDGVQLCGTIILFICEKLLQEANEAVTVSNWLQSS